MAHLRQKDKQRVGQAEAAVMSTLAETKHNGRVTWRFRDYGTYFQPPYNAIAEDETMSRLELRLLWLAFGHCRIEDNVIELKQIEMAQRLRTSRQALSRAMQRLVARGYILQAGHTYTLNPHLGARAEMGEIMGMQRDVRQQLQEGMGRTRR